MTTHRGQAVKYIISALLEFSPPDNFNSGRLQASYTDTLAVLIEVAHFIDYWYSSVGNSDANILAHLQDVVWSTTDPRYFQHPLTASPAFVQANLVSWTLVVSI